MIDPLLTEFGLKVVSMALASWQADVKLSQEIGEFRRQVEAAVRLSHVDERRRQLAPLLNPLQRLLHRVQKEDDKAYTLHLALAAAYAAINEEASQIHHLNQACDCTVRGMQNSSTVRTKAKYRRLRDELLELLGDRRKALIR